ncbi:MAG TPA: YceH family protein [Elusimicrobiales bacterium]|nr:YceH family protein [Elusimicrobiales bacterium]
MLTELDPAEARALGSLVEKSLTTREQYPLTFNALLNACNQKTSRDPVMELDAETLGRALTGLIEKGLAERLQVPGDRVPKFRHDIGRLLGSDDPKVVGTMTVLLLRGPQTPGELKARTERLCSFSGTAEVETLLQGLCDRREDPPVARLPRQAGQKESRYRQLYSGAADVPLPAGPASAPEDRLAMLEKRVSALEAALGGLAGNNGPEKAP